MPLRFVYQDTNWFYVPELNTTPEIYCRYLDDHYIRYSRYLDFVIVDSEISEWGYKKCCKRGNDVYIHLMYQKFKPLLNSFNHKEFFSIKINKNRKRVRKTRMLYITGTCDRDITGDILKSWLNFGSWWNKYITNLRGQFGKIDYVRAWQSQKDGYPHFHALLYFSDYEFTATEWVEQDGSISWRVHNRQMLNSAPVRDRIKAAWKWGSIELKCCDNTKSALVDVVKYVTRDLEGGESDLTNAMVWYFGKQSYAVSKGFTDLFEPGIDLAEPCNADLINAEGVIQSSNSKRILKRIEVFPILRRDLLPGFQQLDLDNWMDPPDPPPEMVDFLERFALNCVPSKVNKKELRDGSVIDVVIFKEVE